MYGERELIVRASLIRASSHVLLSHTALHSTGLKHKRYNSRITMLSTFQQRDPVVSSELQTFETYCETLYGSPHAEDRAKAEAALVQLSTAPENIPHCQFVLSSSTQPYAQLVASNALMRLLQANWNHLFPAQRVEYRNYTLNFLAMHGPSCEHFVCASLIQLLACTTKLIWMELEDPQQILHEAMKFFEATAGHLVIGLQILIHVVTEMNTVSNTRSLAQHRKVAAHQRLALCP